MRFRVPLWGLFLCSPASVIGDGLSDSLIACTRLSADSERLACFDRAAAELKKAAAPQPPARAALTDEQKFGLSQGQVRGLEAQPTPASTPTALHAHIASVAAYPNQKQRFVLDNAQTWQQIDLDPDFVVHQGQDVTISGGALGSFWLATDSHHATRVKRVR